MTRPTSLKRLRTSIDVVSVFELRLQGTGTIPGVFHFRFQPFFTNEVAFKAGAINGNSVRVFRHLLRELKRHLFRGGDLFLFLPFGGLRT